MRWVEGENAGLSFRQAMSTMHIGDDCGLTPRSPRFELERPVKLRVLEQAFDASALDISLGGMKLMTASPIPVGALADVTLDGETLTRLTPKALARARAYLPQSPRAEWPISVERLVALGLTPQLPFFGDVAPDEAAKVHAALEACDLMALKGQAATTLSGGELARAMLARAIVGDPPLLLVDEPTAGLDPRHALDAMARLKARADAGRTVIAAVHDLGLALGHASRVIALRAGRVLADIAAADVDAALLKALYDVDARIVRDDAGVSVRYFSMVLRLRASANRARPRNAISARDAITMPTTKNMKRPEMKSAFMCQASASSFISVRSPKRTAIRTTMKISAAGELC